MGSTEGEWGAEQLLERCLRRPAEAAAWQEFVRRFHPTIQRSVTSAFAFFTANQSPAGSGSCEAIIQDLVQDIYHRLTEKDGAALRSVRGAELGSMKQYLSLISINAVRDHLRAATRAVSNQGFKANTGAALELPCLPAYQHLP